MLTAAHADEGLQDCLLAGSVALEQLLRLAAALRHRQKQMLRRNVFIVQTLSLVAGMFHGVAEPRIGGQ